MVILPGLAIARCLAERGHKSGWQALLAGLLIVVGPHSRALPVGGIQTSGQACQTQDSLLTLSLATGICQSLSLLGRGPTERQRLSLQVSRKQSSAGAIMQTKQS